MDIRSIVKQIIASFSLLIILIIGIIGIVALIVGVFYLKFVTILIGAAILYADFLIVKKMPDLKSN